VTPLDTIAIQQKQHTRLKIRYLLFIWSSALQYYDSEAYEEGKAIPVRGRRGSYIFQAIGSQMAVRLSALRADRPLPPQEDVLISFTGWVDRRVTLRLEGLGQLKNPMTSSGIKPAAFRLVARCLNQLRYRVPSPVNYIKSNTPYILNFYLQCIITLNTEALLWTVYPFRV
jgi:hypothetical protein